MTIGELREESPNYNPMIEAECTIKYPIPPRRPTKKSSIEHELFAVAVNLAGHYIGDGVTKFRDFASVMQKKAPACLWDNTKLYLHAIWEMHATEHPELEEVTRSQAKVIINKIDIARHPINQAAEARLNSMGYVSWRDPIIALAQLALDPDDKIGAYERTSVLLAVAECGQDYKLNSLNRFAAELDPEDILTLELQQIADIAISVLKKY